MNVVWLSANRLGYELLDAVNGLEEVEVSAVITLSEKADTKMYDSINIEKWRNLETEVYEVENINDEQHLIEDLEPDYLVMAGWRQIIKSHILNAPKKSTIGFHPTLLPKGRGSAPVINSIEQDFEHTGATLFHIEESLDSGDIIGQERFEISEKDHASDVYDKIIEKGSLLVDKYFPMLAKNEAPRKPQNEEEATYFEKPSISENEIKLDEENAETIYNKIRARSDPYDGAYLEFGDKKLKIWRASLEDINE